MTYFKAIYICLTLVFAFSISPFANATYLAVDTPAESPPADPHVETPAPADPAPEPEPTAVPKEKEKPKNSSFFEIFDLLSTDEEQGYGKTSTNKDLMDRALQPGASGSPIIELMLRVINILTLLIGGFTFIVLLLGSFTLITAGGDETQIDKGKNILTQALVGLTAAFFSYIAVNITISFFY